MENIFLKLLNMSVTAGWLVLFIILIRLLLKNAPKFIRPVMWLLVGIRLVLPFSFESVLSLIPSNETLPQDVITGPDFNVNTGIGFVDSGVNDYLDDRYFEGVTVPYQNGFTVMQTLSAIWLIGMLIMLIYTVVSYVRIRRKVAESVKLRENIYICDRIDTPFILGVIRPKIYLPSSMNETDMEYVISHEKAHLKRLDYIWKPLGFLLLGVYWFNPLIWLAYVLLCRDIELACDEKVIKETGAEIKKPYSEALINCSMPRKLISACPLAFGEVGVKGRIKSVLNYKKPAFWIIVISVIALLVTAVCFLTNPKENRTEPNLGVVGSSSGGDTDRVYMTLTETDFEKQTVKVKIKNNYNDTLCYGDDFRLFRDTEELFIKEGYGWDDVLYTLFPDGETETDCYLHGFDISQEGTYRLEKEFYFQNEPDKKYNVYVSFIIGERYSVVEKRYMGEKVIFHRVIDSFSLNQEDIPEFYITDKMHLIMYSDKEEDLGVLTETKLNRESFKELFNFEVWEKGFSAESLLKNNKIAFQLVDGESGNRYCVLEQKNGDIFICSGYLDGFYLVFEMTEKNKSSTVSQNDSSSSDTASAEPNTEVYFNATVLEVRENSVLVEPFEGEDERNTSDKISVSTNVISTNPVPDLKTGDKIRVVYNGEILTIYPATLGKVFAIYLLNEDETVEYYKPLVSFGVDSAYLLSRENLKEDFKIAKTYFGKNIAEDFEKFLNSKYCEERSEGNWVKFNPAKPNNYALAISLENGGTLLLNIHFSPENDSGYYIAIAQTEEHFDVTKDYSNLEYKRYVVTEEFGSFLKSLIP